MPYLEQLLDALEVGINQPSEATLSGLFDDSFFALLPLPQLHDFLGKMTAEFGNCVGHEVLERRSATMTSVRWRFAQGYRSEGVVAVAEHDQSRITLLNFGLPTRDEDNWQDASAGAEALPGKVGCLILDIGSNETLASIQQGLPLGVGSVSKLVVFTHLLDEIGRGRVAWDQVLELQQRHISAPSGVMHSWPIGAPVTVHSVAILMLSLSDNTAVDMLLDWFGRNRIEETMDRLGIGLDPRSRPFLSTRAIFRIVASPVPSAEAYIRSSDEARREIVADAELHAPHLEDQTPEAWPDDLDWFFSCADVVTVLTRICHQIQQDPVASAIMAMSTGGVASKEWAFVGYKGGSSPGRLSLATLLRDKGGRWVAATLTQNTTPGQLVVPDTGIAFKRLTDLALTRQK